MKPLQSPFAHLSRLDLLTAQDLRLWASSSLGQAIISTLRPSAAPYSPWVRDGKAVCSLNGRARSTRAELQAEKWYKDRQGVEAYKASEAAKVETLLGHQFSLERQAEGERVRRLAASRQPEPWRIGSSAGYKLPVLGRYVLHPNFRPGPKPLRQRLETTDVLAGLVHSIALQSSSAAIRAMSKHSQLSEASRDDALLCAIASVAEELHRLGAKSWDHAERFAAPAFQDRTLLSERARRRYLFRAGYRAAYRSLSALPAGFVGRKHGGLYLAELTEWSAGAWTEPQAELYEQLEFLPVEETRASAYETLPCTNPEARMRQARLLAWQRIVEASPFGYVSQLGTLNLKHLAGFRAAVRRWAVFVRILQGESEQKAVERVGFGASFIKSGRLNETITQALNGRAFGGSYGVESTVIR